MKNASIVLISTATVEANDLFSKGLKLGKEGYSNPQFCDYLDEIICVVSKGLNIDFKKALLVDHVKLMQINKDYDFQGDTLLIKYILDTQNRGDVVEIDNKPVEIKIIS